MQNRSTSASQFQMRMVEMAYGERYRWRWPVTSSLMALAGIAAMAWTRSRNGQWEFPSTWSWQDKALAVVMDLIPASMLCGLVYGSIVNLLAAGVPLRHPEGQQPPTRRNPADWFVLPVGLIGGLVVAVARQS